MPTKNADDLLLFSGAEFVDHPWHDHSTRILEISTKLDASATGIRGLCNEGFTFHNDYNGFVFDLNGD